MSETPRTDALKYDPIKCSFIVRDKQGHEKLAKLVVAAEEVEKIELELTAALARIAELETEIERLKDEIKYGVPRL